MQTAPPDGYQALSRRRAEYCGGGWEPHDDITLLGLEFTGAAEDRV